jgi:hypothetical protein
MSKMYESFRFLNTNCNLPGSYSHTARGEFAADQKCSAYWPGGRLNHWHSANLKFRSYILQNVPLLWEGWQKARRSRCTALQQHAPLRYPKKIDWSEHGSQHSASALPLSLHSNDKKECDPLLVLCWYASHNGTSQYMYTVGSILLRALLVGENSSYSSVGKLKLYIP